MATPIDLDHVAHTEREAQSRFLWRVMACSSTACRSAGADAVRSTVDQMVAETGRERDVQVVPTSCMGLCSRGPLVRVKPRGETPTLYGDVDVPVARRILDEHIGAGTPVDEHVLDGTIPFFSAQERLVLANAGEINPDRLEDYVARGGYRALERVLHSMSPRDVVEEVRISGLRGRGGGGYPTGKKWAMLLEAEGDTKYVIANGDEGDPGAYMDRTIMEDDPHRVLEGLVIAGYATGASKGYVYVRAEYPLAVERLERAIRVARRQRLLGRSILDSEFGFEIEVRIGAGAFVCGEETALMASIEGKRGTPSIRPPYPTQRGLWGAPSMIQNVETLANIPAIITRGAGAFSSIGTESSKGTKVFALAGDLVNTGLIEVPMGITLREIVYEIGGGIPDGKEFKAAQTGGPSGGCIPAEFLDTPVDYESLQALGSIMGSGGLVVMDEDVRMPDVAKFFMEFCVEESCGKCIPCRAGTVQLARLLECISAGEGCRTDLRRLEELCHMVRHTSLCGLGQTAPNPVLSTLRYFRDEYEGLLRGAEEVADA